MNKITIDNCHNVFMQCAYRFIKTNRKANIDKQLLSKWNDISLVEIYRLFDNSSMEDKQRWRNICKPLMIELLLPYIIKEIKTYCKQIKMTNDDLLSKLKMGIRTTNTKYQYVNPDAATPICTCIDLLKYDNIEDILYKAANITSGSPCYIANILRHLMQWPGLEFVLWNKMHLAVSNKLFYIYTTPVKSLMLKDYECFEKNML